MCLPVLLMSAVTRCLEGAVRRWHGTDAALDMLVSFGICAPFVLYAETVVAAMYLRLRRSDALGWAQWGEVLGYKDVVPTLARMTLMCAVWMVPALAVMLLVYAPVYPVVQAVVGAARVEGVMKGPVASVLFTAVAEGAYGWFMARYALVLPQMAAERAGGGEVWAVAVAKAVVRRRALRWVCVLQYAGCSVLGRSWFAGGAMWKPVVWAAAGVVVTSVATVWCELVKVEVGESQ